MVRELRARHVTLGVISNCFAEGVSAWSTWPLAREFESRVFSCEAGLAKPDPEIYRKAMRELGVEAETTVYVGDGGDDELAGAQRAGLRAFRATWFVTVACDSMGDVASQLVGTCLELTCVEDGESLWR